MYTTKADKVLEKLGFFAPFSKKLDNPEEYNSPGSYIREYLNSNVGSLAGAGLGALAGIPLGILASKIGKSPSPMRGLGVGALTTLIGTHIGNYSSLRKGEKKSLGSPVTGIPQYIGRGLAGSAGALGGSYLFRKNPIGAVLGGIAGGVLGDYGARRLFFNPKKYRSNNNENKN